MAWRHQEVSGARTDRLPRLFISGREQRLKRSPVQYLVRVAGDIVGLQVIHPQMLRHSWLIILPTKARICAPCRAISGIAIRGIPCPYARGWSPLRTIVENVHEA